jgi:hemolysin III
MHTNDHEQGTEPGGPLKHVVSSLSETFEAIDAYGDRPFWRGRLHLIAAIVAVPAGLALVLAARGAAGRVAAGIYAVSLVALFTVSASYHRLAHTETAVKWFRRADHSMIFVLIAGSYTPICLVALPPQWGIPLLVVVWVTALAGITVKMLKVTANGDASGSWMYIVIGWAAVVALPALVTSLTAGQVALLGAGGLLYTVGAIGLWRRWPNPSPVNFGYHEVWHGMTIAAGVCHFALMAAILH